MSAHELLAEVNRFDGDVPIERAWAPPSSWYTDPSLFEIERRAVFARSWQPFARLAELGAVGAYRGGCFVGQPWLVVRDRADAVRAFHNVCRHKGREVVIGDGRADELVCDYHAWRYGLDGSLRSAPRIGGIEGFDRADMGLVPLASETWGSWVFVNGEENPLSLSSQVTELTARLDLSRWLALRFVARRSWVIDCNWKVYVDNYLDGGYHIPHMHPSLDAQLDMASYRTELFERFSIQTSDATSRDGGELAVDPGARIGSGAIYAWIYPNLMLNRYGPCLDTNYVVPLSHDRCEVHYEFYFLETEGDDAQRFIAASIEQADVTQREDIAICESVQRGLGSFAYDRGRYAPTVEVGEHHFHRLLADDLRAELSRRCERT